MQLYDHTGQRKYLTQSERRAFLKAARFAPPKVRTFCETLAHTGCRISEALALTPVRVDISAGLIVLESLKKRRRGIYRAVPVPPELLQLLEQVHDLNRLCLDKDSGPSLRLWNWSRTTGWRRVRDVMDAAEIRGLYGAPKGLRHGFGINAITSEVPLNMAQKWLGHASITTTSIYADAVGAEERKIAKRMWEQ